ncbi:PA1571 family protein [Pseudomonas sp. Irchel 3A7]|jgi:hypothetical protein|uniref:PA1571 family protein n=1 Tax=Pseudomonas sp. Irchel 3A7 TaxID=2008913 RepID=UPI0014839EF7|nr:PA1571 family protein [Pseudomonas sp. Irchel 3A7]
MSLNSSDVTVPVIRPKRDESLDCSIVDEKGREIPITEEMIQKACRDLEKRLVKPAEQK